MLPNPVSFFIISHCLKIYYQNVRGLKSKTNVFRTELMSNSYDVILLCETWLNDDVFTSELFDDRYIVYRNDRDNVAMSKNDGGGCLIAIRKELISRRVPEFALNNDVWVSVEQLNGGKAYFNVKYIELKTKPEAYRKHFEKIVDNVMSSGVNDSFILTGDYNLGNSITWCYDSTSGEFYASDVMSPIANELLDTLSLCNLNQLNVTRNGIGRTLDLFLTTIQPNRVGIVRSSRPLVSEDAHHPALQVSADLSQFKYLKEKRPPKINFYKANYVKLNQDLMKVD